MYTERFPDSSHFEILEISQAFKLKTFGLPTLHASSNQRSFSREQRQGRRQRERQEEAQGAPSKLLDIYLFQLVF